MRGIVISFSHKDELIKISLDSGFANSRANKDFEKGKLSLFAVGDVTLK